jgi:hypothetical protein
MSCGVKHGFSSAVFKLLWGLTLCSEGLDWLIQQAGLRGIRLLLTFTTYRARPQSSLLPSSNDVYMFPVKELGVIPSTHAGYCQF